MRQIRFVSCLFAGLLLGGCGASDAVSVYNAEGKKVGEIKIVDDRNVELVNSYGEGRGKARGGLVRDDTGKRLGNVVTRDGMVVITNTNDDDVGTLSEDGTDCYGKGKDVVGRISVAVRAEAAGAACLVFFLQ